MQRPVIFLILHFPFFTASVKQKQMNIPHHLLSTSWLSFAACPRQTVNSAISGLVKNGYVSLKQLAGAGNTKAVYLTEKGTQLCRQIVIPLIEAEQHSLAQMTAEEVELCLKLSVRQLDLFEEELALILPKKEHPSGE